MREYTVERKTKESDIRLSLNIDGRGRADVNTGCGFLDHMLELFSHHSKFDLSVYCKGDTHVDYHHTAEDIAIALGEAVNKALGDRKGINRYADIHLVMDEALVLCALDISGRAYLSYDAEIPAQKIGDFDSELIEEFFCGFVRTSNITLHLKKLDGRNSHHIAEALFKAFARCMRKAVAPDVDFIDEIPSSKGVL